MSNKFIIKLKNIIEELRRIKPDIFLDIIKLLIFFPISVIFSPKLKKSNIWLIEEKPTEANDNGYALLKYIKENRPDINVYYVIDKKSKKLQEVEKISNIIVHKSIKHWIYYFNAKVIAVTQKYANPSPAIFYVLHNFKLIRGKRVFLQHGITKDDIKCYYYNVSKFDLFICGARKEFEYVKRFFGYTEKQVVYTGFARFDNYSLIDNKMTNNQKNILICPTWRNWIKDKKKNYEYFNRWNEVINNSKLNEILEKNNINVRFILHQEINKFKGRIESKYKRIKIFANNEINYEEELKECTMLVTDFSSIFFDIAYMKKPIIYYQFDLEQFRKLHLPQGYFSYEDDGFGEILSNSNSVVNKIIEYIENNFKMKDIYLKRVDSFFERRDNSNSRRIVEAIEKIIS